MAVRTNGLSILFTGIGRGSVYRDLPPEDLAPLDDRIVAPRLEEARNCRLLDGLATPRPGYEQIDSSSFAGTIYNGLYLGVYSNDIQTLYRATKSGVDYYSSGTWSAVTFSGGHPNNSPVDTDTWQFSMVRKSGGGNQMFFCNGTSDLYGYTGSGTVASIGATIFTGPRTVIGVGGRAMAGNVKESSVRYEQRIRYSIVGDPTDFDTAKIGAGAVDLDDDPWPIATMTVLNSRPVVFKGSPVGGSIVVGTPTGLAVQPYRWDALTGRESSVGILYPRTLLVLTPGLAFFVGHDGIYLYDGARALEPICKEITRYLFANAHLGRTRGGLAWYKPRSYEIYFGIPYGSDDWPIEYWVYNLREKRLSGGPYYFASDITAASYYSASSGLAWSAVPSAYTWTTNPYTTWSSVAAATANPSIVLATANGGVYRDDDSATTDLGVEISPRVTLPPILPTGRVIRTLQGQPRTLEENDVLVLQDVALVYDDEGSWTPLVEHSTDGGSTWTTLLSGTPIGTGTGRLMTYTWAVDSIPGTWHQLRVSGPEMRLHGVRCDFSVRGSARNE
jgi:hypothetical protein